jgi:hypothetical protein
MSWEARGLPVLRVELWHGLLVAALLALVPLEWVEPTGLLLGGLFMGVNFLLLAVGIRWVITPFANKGRVRAGVFLLILKFCFLLGASWMLLTRIAPDAVSFAVGVNCLILAILWDRFYDTKFGK